jgi:hypothetical protein
LKVTAAAATAAATAAAAAAAALTLRHNELLWWTAVAAHTGQAAYIPHTHFKPPTLDHKSSLQVTAAAAAAVALTLRHDELLWWAVSRVQHAVQRVEVDAGAHVTCGTKVDDLHLQAAQEQAGGQAGGLQTTVHVQHQGRTVETQVHMSHSAPKSMIFTCKAAQERAGRQAGCKQTTVQH